MLEIRSLKVSYGDVPVLKDINLKVENNEVLAILGESGAGKTTLALALMGLCEGKVEGDIYLGGVNLISLKQREMRKLRWKEISIVFQDTARALNPVLTIMEQITEAITEKQGLGNGEAEKLVFALLREVGLREECARLYPHQLSGGERQRVLIAMAIANDPGVLVLDEPTSALDTINRAEILKLLRRISRGRSVILVTHDIATAAKLSDRVAVLYGGRIVELGNKEAVLKEPAHPYTRGLIRSYPNMTTTKDLQGIPGSFEEIMEACPFYNRCTQCIERCKTEVPDLKKVAGRYLACHREGIVTLLEVKDLEKKFGKFCALKGVSIRIDEGETLAVVGESGSGKTTLARCIMGLENRDKGSVYFCGKRISCYDREFYGSVQMIFQTPQDSVSHRLNVLETVTEPLEVQKIGTPEERKERAIKAIAEVQLPVTEKFLHRYAHHLSGGEIQRVAIARALVLEPKLLIADEPTAALDASVQAKIIKLLLDLQEKRGLSILFITHDIALARKVSDRIAVVLAGEIVEEGPTHEIFAQPGHPYTEELLRLAPDFSFEIPDIQYEKKVASGLCSYIERCKKAQQLCACEKPRLVSVGGRMVRCHLLASGYTELSGVL